LEPAHGDEQLDYNWTGKGFTTDDAVAHEEPRHAQAAAHRCRGPAGTRRCHGCPESLLQAS